MPADLVLRQRNVHNALRDTSVDACGAKHHHVWNYGQELDLCSEHIRANSLGCAHFKNLKLRAAIVLMKDLGIVDQEQQTKLLFMLDLYEQNLTMFDMGALDAGSSQNAEVVSLALTGFGADPGDVNSYTPALVNYHKKILAPVALLKQATIEALELENPDFRLLWSFVRHIDLIISGFRAFDEDYTDVVQAIIAGKSNSSPSS